MRFHLASNPGDYAACQKLLKEAELPKQKLSWPTIMAFHDEDGLVGFLSTEIQDKMIIAGPLVIKPGRRRIWTAMRLIETYENAMRNISIKSYIFSAEMGTQLDTGIQRLYETLPYASRDGRNFYIRKLDNGRQHEGSRPVS